MSPIGRSLALALVVASAVGCASPASDGDESVEVEASELATPSREINWLSGNWLLSDQGSLYSRESSGRVVAVATTGSRPTRWIPATTIHTGTLNTDTRGAGLYRDGTGDFYAPVFHLDRWLTVEVQRLSAATGATKTVLRARVTGVTGFDLIAVTGGVIYAYVALPDTSTRSLSGEEFAPPFQGIVAIDTAVARLAELTSLNITSTPGVRTLSSGFARSNGFVFGNAIYYLGRGLCSTPLASGPETCIPVPATSPTWRLHATSTKLFFVEPNQAGRGLNVWRIYSFQPGVDTTPKVVFEAQAAYPASSANLVLATRGNDVYFSRFGLGHLGKEVGLYRLPAGATPVPQELGRFITTFQEASDITALTADGTRLYFLSTKGPRDPVNHVESIGGAFSVPLT